jgi:hypothetical protein
MDAMVFTVLGSVNYSEISSEIDKYFKGVLTKYTIWNFSKADPKKHLTSDEAQKLGLQVKSYAGKRADTVDILIVPGILQHGLSRIFQAYSAVPGKDGTTEICKNIEECFEFIRHRRPNAKSGGPETQKE